MKDLSIRLAKSSERLSLEELQRRASLNNPGDREALLANPDAIDLPVEQIEANQVFVAERNAEIVGFSAVLPREDGNVELDGLFVEPDIWKSGIGHALVARAADYTRQANAARLHVVGNPHAEGFYHAVGFETVGTFSTRFGKGLLMEMVV